MLLLSESFSVIPPAPLPSTFTKRNSCEINSLTIVSKYVIILTTFIFLLFIQLFTLWEKLSHYKVCIPISSRISYEREVLFASLAGWNSLYSPLPKSKRLSLTSLPFCFIVFSCRQPLHSLGLFLNSNLASGYKWKETQRAAALSSFKMSFWPF